MLFILDLVFDYLSVCVCGSFISRQQTFYAYVLLEIFCLNFFDNYLLIILARHCRQLTRYLTHMHLPGLSSVDQMHLLAVADTSANFSADAIDKLTLANDSKL